MSGKIPDRGTSFPSWLWRISNLWHSCLRSQWSIVPKTMRSDMSTAQLCWITSINGIWTEKTEKEKAPKVDKSNWMKIMEYIVLHLKLTRRGSGELSWPMWSGTMSRWQISCLDIQPIWALIRIWLPEPIYSWHNVKPQKIQNWLDMRNVDSQCDALQNDKALCILSSLSCSMTWTFIAMWYRERVCWMIKLCLDILKQFWGLISVSGRLQMQKEGCKAHTMAVRATWRSVASVLHSTKSKLIWRTI